MCGRFAQTPALQTLFSRYSFFGEDEAGDVLFTAFDGRIYRFTSAAATGRDGETALPAVAELKAPYPNPTAGTATIEFHVDRAAQIRLDLVDLLGRQRALVFDGSTPAGLHQVQFDAAGLPAGVYLVRLQLDEHTRTRRLILTR